MASAAAPTEPAWRRSLERAHALSALLPAALLLWPGLGGPLAGDLDPDLSGAGWVALASIPAGLGVVLRGAYVGAPLVLAYVAFLLVGWLSLELGAPTDTLAASRAGLLGLATLACLLAGASLRAEGRRWLAGGAIALTLLALLPAAFAAEAGLAGALGNKAATSEAALAGAITGAVLLAAPGRWTRSAGGAAALLFALHAGRAPVLAGALALGLALAAAALFAPPVEGGTRRRRVLLALLLCVAAAIGGRLERRAPPAPAPTAQPGLPAPSDVRGLRVRALVAQAALGLFAEHPWLGVGPGQFAAEFPPHRDPREIELSTLGHNLPGQTTEVEHAHDDWLQGFLDTGLVGGALWLAFLLGVARRSLRALRGADVTGAALGAATLGILLEAIARAPLLSNPASACTAFALFGTVIAPSEAQRRRSALTRLLVHAALLLLAFQAPRAVALVRHGRELARLATWESPRTPLLLRALAACPDSVLARSLYARLAPREAQARGAQGPVDVVPLWQAVLELRPHRFEALVELGNAWARSERLEQAREAYDEALALDPDDPVLLANLARLEVEAGRPAAALEHAGRLARAGRLPEGWVEGAAVDALRRLDLDTARALLRHAHPDWGELGPQEAWERSQLLEADPERGDLARALRGLAHVGWAREQIAAEAPELAIRSFRQALQALSWRPAEGAEVQSPPALGLELAAALLRAGRPEEAAQEVARAAAGPRDLARLASWAGNELMAAGLIGR